jgi:glycosyltransferase involved in cell wall biosynthesis
MSKSKSPIAYLTQSYPDLTTVYREVLALRARGLAVKTFATWHPKSETVSQEARCLIDETFYIFPIQWGAFWKAHMGYLLNKPLVYLATLLFVLTRPGQSLSKRKRTLFHFAEAVYLAAEIERQNIRHIHVHFAHNAATLALVVERLIGVPFSFTAHAVGIFADQVILKEKIKAARFIVAISEYNKRFLVKYAGDPKFAEKIYVIHSGIPIADFSPGTHSPPTSTGLPLILSVSRLVEKKGFPFLIRACKHLHDQGYRARCVIIGSGPEEEKLHHLIHDLGMQDWIKLTGWLDQAHVRAHLEKATLFALPCIVATDGDQDGIPAVLMEAMAMAKPCVSTIVSGIPELIDNGHSGLLVPEKDEVALADALCHLLDDPGLADRLGQTAQQKVCRAFNLDRISDQLLLLFTNQVSGTPEASECSLVASLACVKNRE